MATRRKAPAPAPPIEPMLAKVAGRIPDEGDFLYEPKWDGFRAIVFRDGDDVYIQSRDLRPLDRYFPELHEALARALPEPAACSTARSSIAGAAGPRLRRAAAAPAPGRLARGEAGAGQTPAAFVAFDLLAVGRRAICATRRRPSAGGCWKRLLREGEAADPPHARHARPRASPPTGSSVSRARASTASSPSRRSALPARQARDAQGQARAHRRLRRRRFPLAQERRRTRWARCCSASTTTTACCTTSA